MSTLEEKDCVEIKAGHRLRGMIGDVLAIRPPSKMVPHGAALMQRRSCNHNNDEPRTCLVTGRVVHFVPHVWETHPTSTWTEWISLAYLKSPSWLSS